MSDWIDNLKSLKREQREHAMELRAILSLVHAAAQVQTQRFDSQID
jgi:hypothetical protein